MTVGPAVEPSVSWLDDLPDHLSGHQRVLRALVAAAERDARLQTIQVQGSLGRGDADRLSDLLETRVKVELGKHKGKIVVEFASHEDLERIVRAMSPETSGLEP